MARLVVLNGVWCRRCNQIIWSRDADAPLIWCRCRCIGIAGGLRYVQRVTSGARGVDWVEMLEYIDTDRQGELIGPFVDVEDNP